MLLLQEHTSRNHFHPPIGYKCQPLLRPAPAAPAAAAAAPRPPATWTEWQGLVGDLGVLLGQNVFFWILLDVDGCY